MLFDYLVLGEGRGGEGRGGEGRAILAKGILNICPTHDPQNSGENRELIVCSRANRM